MSENNEETLISHLEALREVLIKCLLALAIGLLPIFYFTPCIMDKLIDMMSRHIELKLNFFSPMEVFILELKMALLLDILVCFPYMARKVWLFVLPALYEKERRFIRSIVGISSFLFIAGVLFCLFLILPMVMRFGISFATDNITPMLGVSNVISLVLWLSVIFGLMFQFPLVTYALIRADIVSVKNVKDKRRYVFLGILLLSGILTPPDVISQLMLTVPTYVLFELGLYFGAKSRD